MRMRTVSWRKRWGTLPWLKALQRPRDLAVRFGAMRLLRLISPLLLLLLTETAHASFLPSGSSPAALDYWSFTDTNTWFSDLGYATVSFTNLNSSQLGNGNCLVLDNTNAAW